MSFLMISQGFVWTFANFQLILNPLTYRFFQRSSEVMEDFFLAPTIILYTTSLYSKTLFLPHWGGSSSRQRFKKSNTYEFKNLFDDQFQHIKVFGGGLNRTRWLGIWPGRLESQKLHFQVIFRPLNPLFLAPGPILGTI